MSEIRVELTDWMGSDLKVCQMAKDSFGRTTDWEHHGVDLFGEPVMVLSEKDKRLLKMLSRGMGEKEYYKILDDASECDSHVDIEKILWKFRNTTPHLAPFGHCFATFKFKAPVFVMRQIVKHEYIRISELSMRYVRDMPEYFRPKSWRALAEDVKQGSGDQSVNEFTASHLYQYLDMAQYEDGDAYKKMIDPNGSDKLCPEQARMFLRLCHMTEGHLSGSMDAIAGIVNKRLDPHAQAETRDFASQIDAQMFKPFPLSWAALTEGVQRN